MTDNNQLKTLSEQLEAVQDDPCLTNLYFRYYQGLELGDSHFRESMYLDRFPCGVYNSSETVYLRCYSSKNAVVEQKILQQNPNVDACQMRLYQQYLRQNGD